MKTTSIILALAALALCASQAAFAASSYFVPSMTNYSQEALTWCGAAAGQTIATGYPSGACTRLQSDVWDAIQINKVEAAWDTDPKGLAKALMAVCPLPPLHSWVAMANTDATKLMYWVAYYMTGNHYPVALLLDGPHNTVTSHQEHWVTVKGIVANADPHTTSTITLQYILIVDQPDNLGDPAVERWMSGSDFYAQFKPVGISSSTYKGQYVAVIEPPTATGIAIAKKLPVAGTIIPIDRIPGIVQQLVKSEAFRQAPAFRELATMQPQRPVLVNGERGSAYYLVPFGTPGKDGGAVLVNAYSGEFMEAGRFRVRPLLSSSEAVERLRTYLGSRQLTPSKAVLVDSEASPYFPVWEVSVAGRDLQVTSSGKVRPLPRTH